MHGVPGKCFVMSILAAFANFTFATDPENTSSVYKSNRLLVKLDLVQPVYQHVKAGRLLSFVHIDVYSRSYYGNRRP